MNNTRHLRFEMSDGVLLDAIARGPEHDMPLVLLHGYSDSWHSFEMLMDSLPVHLHVIAISQRGHGLSTKPERAEDYSAGRLADDVVEVLDAVGHRLAVICGHSMGAWVALHVVTRAPDRVAGLILIGAFAGFSGNPAVQSLRPEILALTNPVSVDFVRGFQQAASSPTLPAAFLEDCVRESLRLPAAVWQHLLGAFFQDELPHPLAHIGVPVQLIWGDQDPFVPNADQSVLQNAIPGARLKIYSQVGHSPHWEQPAQVAEDVTGFCARIIPRRDDQRGSVLLQKFMNTTQPFALTDGGIETTLIFDDHQDLPLFSAFPLLKTEAGRMTLRRYYERFIQVARDAGTGFVLESPTSRSSPDWADALGYTKAELASLNRDAILLMQSLREEHETPELPMLISGCVGPRGDGYVAGVRMRQEVAEAYHSEQVRVMVAAGAELITAITMTYTEEAIGIARASRAVGKPCVIAFTVETDGLLPSGEPLGEAIMKVDAATGGYPEYFMINCAHPTHFDAVLGTASEWLQRIGGIRANASCQSHAELNEATELERGDVSDLARWYTSLRRRMPQLRVLGGCCGTDHTHMRAIANACAI